jgi:hypothetical protein
MRHFCHCLQSLREGRDWLYNNYVGLKRSYLNRLKLC